MKIGFGEVSAIGIMVNGDPYGVTRDAKNDAHSNNTSLKAESVAQSSKLVGKVRFPQRSKEMPTAETSKGMVQ